MKGGSESRRLHDDAESILAFGSGSLTDQPQHACMSYHALIRRLFMQCFSCSVAAKSLTTLLALEFPGPLSHLSHTRSRAADAGMGFVTFLRPKPFVDRTERRINRFSPVGIIRRRRGAEGSLTLLAAGKSCAPSTPS
jgi:hypothetical protein